MTDKRLPWASGLAEKNLLALSLLDVSDQGLLVARGSDGRILLANPAAGRLLELGAEHLIDQSVSELPIWSPSRSWQHELETLRADPRERRFTALIPNDAATFEVRLNLYRDHDSDYLLLALVDLRAQQRDEAQLRDSDARFRGILEKLPTIAVQGYDEERCVTFWNQANVGIYGYRPEEALGRKLEDLIIPEQMREALIAHVDAWYRQGVEIPPAELTLRRKDGSPVTVFSSHVMQRYSSGRCEMFCVDVDLTEIRAAEERLHLAGIVFDSAAEGIYLADAGAHIIEINRAFTVISGFSRTEVLGRHLNDFDPDEHPPGRQAIRRALAETGQWSGEIQIRHKDLRILPLLLGISRVVNPQGKTTHYVGVFSDLTQQRAFQYRADYLAHHDVLTELPNRLLFKARLDHALSRAERSHEQLAVFFLDLDRFKGVNEALGHHGGDQLLCEVAWRLCQSLRHDDTVARFGGDELIVLAEGIGSISNAGHIAENLLRIFSQPFVLAGSEVFMTASVGVAAFPRHGQDSAQLMRNAESALRQAKLAGGDTHAFYSTEITLKARERIQIESDLHRAVKSNELCLYYQPQVRMDTGDVIGVEALARWQHPRRGLLLPSYFIPIAESSGLIVGLGEWALRKAARQARAWLDMGCDFGRVHVNVAHAQIHRGDLHRVVRSVLAETGLPAQRLGLEITEGVAMEVGDRVIIDELKRLKHDGVGLSIDDFGTGYSSLSRLKQLTVDQLKIDRSFVSELGRVACDLDIVRAIITLGSALNLEVIAEGIETDEQAALLLAENCMIGQGYLYAAPMCSEAFVEWMRSRTGES